MKNLYILPRATLCKVCSGKPLKIIKLIVLLLLLVSYNVYSGISEQQQKRITGVVTDISGNPLPGVTVLVKGTSLGTTSGPDGKFQFEISQDAKMLQFSFIGMKTQEIAINDDTSFSVIMEEESIGLEEVVVIGYGSTKKITLTGAVTSVSTKDLKSSASDNLSTRLAGKLPGLRVTQRTGEPGAFSTLYDIRGFGTPLIVVDGIVMDGSDFVRLDPHTIDQISILKDASAAVYGVKAANGVILVTTKKGEIGKPKIVYSGSYTLSKYINLPEQCNAYEFATLLTQSEINSGRSPTATTYSPDDLQKFKDGTYPSTNWFELVTRKYTTAQKNNISITGGSDRIKYFSSISILDEMGIWKSGDLTYNQYSAKTVVTGKITDNLEAEISLDGRLDKRHQAIGVSGVFETMWMHSLPTIPVYANNNPDYLSETVDGLHPLAETTSSITGYTNTSNKAFQGTLTLNYKVPFVDGLQAKLMYGYYDRVEYTKRWSRKHKFYVYDKVNDIYNNTLTRNDPSTLYGTYSPFQRSSLLGQLTYNKVVLENHNIKTTLVFEQRHDINDNLQASKQFSIDIDQFYAGLSNPTVTSSNISENENQNVIGRLNYDYLSKYLFEFGFNYSGSSKFPKGKRWGFFPYTSAGWRISEEEFFKSKLPFITNLKIRGSWGKMGDDGASTFQFLTGYNYPSGNYIINDKTVSGLGFRGMPNQNITWYTATTKNIGIDVSINNGLMNLQFDLFRRDRSGLLATRALTIPGTVGANLPQENLDEDMRRGFELVLGQSRKIGELYYDISANFTYTRSQKTYIERTPDGNSYLDWRNNTTGRWDNIGWGYNYIGQFQSQEDLNTSPIQDSQGNRTLKPGDLKYEDVNKDGLITSIDQIPISRSTVPDINFGFNGAVSYRQFDMTILIQGAANYNHTRQNYFKGPLPWNRNSLKIFMDNWHHEDIYDATSPWIPGRFPSAATRGTPPSNGWTSQFWTEDAKYVRLKSMEIGYTINKTLASKLHIQDLRIYLSGFNLLTLCEMKDVDPELLLDVSYPLTRDITFGASITF